MSLKEGAASVKHRLLIGLQSKADVRADEVIGAFVAGGRAAVVIWYREAQHRDPHAVAMSEIDLHITWRSIAAAALPPGLCYCAANRRCA